MEWITEAKAREVAELYYSRQLAHCQPDEVGRLTADRDAFNAEAAAELLNGAKTLGQRTWNRLVDELNLSYGLGKALLDETREARSAATSYESSASARERMVLNTTDSAGRSRARRWS